ncbi:Cytochrome c oxidase subunit 6A mitochondrial [Spathaspora sp. JA1]|nr:Cytochrome c oxidase subunit 6A mitochondrial [Spathaspora sp. JA1]
MFKAAQRTFRRNAHHYAPSKYLKDPAFPPSKVNKAAGEAFIKDHEGKVAHSKGISLLWKKLTFFVALPAILLTAIPVTKLELEHAEHRKHQRHMTDEEWPTQYAYQNIRSKPYFWGDGDKTMFWNSDINRHVQD